MPNKHISHNPATSATIEWVNPFIAVGLFFINPIIAASNAVFYLLIKYDIHQTESKNFPLSAFIAQYTTTALALTACKFLPQTYALFITPFVLFSYLISNILFVEKPAAYITTRLSQSKSSNSILGSRPETPYSHDRAPPSTPHPSKGAFSTDQKMHDLAGLEPDGGPNGTPPSTPSHKAHSPEALPEEKKTANAGDFTVRLPGKADELESRQISEDGKVGRR